ncbi:hypothetical protein ABPG74_003844 [Tetrahymena malaccensis]
MRRSLLTVALIAVCLLSFAMAVHIRKDKQKTLESKSKLYSAEGDEIHTISLKKIPQSPGERRKAIELLSTAQYYSYNKNDYSDEKDFIYTQQKETSFSSTSSSSKTSTHTVKLYNFKNVQYTGDLAIGSSDNVFSVIYDTGSANIWMNSIHCNDPGCVSHKQYDFHQSKNYKSVGLSLDVQFGTGELIGEMATDTVYFGDIEIKDQTFVEIHEQRGDVFAQSKFDGIVGLAFPSMAAYNKNPLFDSLMEQKKISKNIFSFYMSPHDGRTDSEISIGGANPLRYSGEIKYHKVKKDYYWLIEAQSILVGGQDVGLCKGGCYVIADTGTSLITGPSEDIFTLLDHSSANTNCSNVSELPDLTFVIDGAHYTLTGEEYVLQENSDGSQQTVETAQSNVEMSSSTAQCIVAFMPLDIPNDEENFPYEKAWILGDTFLQKFYSIYDRDNDRVGFALARH